MSRRLASLALPALTLLAATPAAAQSEDGQLWEQVNLNVPLTPELRVTLEQIGRWGERADGLLQTEYGVLGSYRVAKGVEIGIGYRRVGLYSATAPDVQEDRLRQQVVVSRGRFVGRFRVDERFNPGSDEVGFRVRPLLRYNLPVSRGGTAIFFSHESFLIPNTTSYGQRAGYERMRNWVGVTLPFFGKKVVADVGYLNQFRPGRAGARDQMDHAISLQVTINAIGPILHD